MAHRYWQVDIQTCAAGIFGALSKIEMATSAGGTNLCTSGPACAASSSQGSPHTPDAALLGTGYWGGAGSLPVQWRYDMGSAVDISEVRITSISGLEPYHPATWNLRASDDDSSYTTVASFTSASWVGGVQQVFGVVLPIPAGAISLSGFAPTPSGTGTLTVTQIGAEAWVSNDPSLLLTQLGSEAWVSSDPALVLTQIGVEAWVSVIEDPAIPPGSLLFTGFAPSVPTSNPTPASGQIIFTGFAPPSDSAATPAEGVMTLTGFAPTSVLSSLPDAGQISITGFAPTSSVRPLSSPLFSIIL